MNNPGPSGFKSVGYIDRAHGLHGEVMVVWGLPDPSVIDDQENLLVFLKNNRGDLYPLRALSFRKENKRSSPSFFVRFDKIANRSQAEAIKHRHLFIDAQLYNAGRKMLQKKAMFITGLLISMNTAI